MNFVKETAGIDVSKKLLAFIMNPEKLNGLNYVALKEIKVQPPHRGGCAAYSAPIAYISSKF